MSCDAIALALPGVKGLRPYEPGKPVEDLQRELGLRDIIKLASNENPLGPSPLALDAVRAALPGTARYPDGNGFRLKAALSDRYGVETRCITLGNGSNDILELVARAFVSPEHEVMFSEHAFAVYPIVTQAVGARAVVVPARDWGHDLEAMAAAVTDRTRVIFIANPNNPTGTLLDSASLKAFVSTVPDQVLVVLDEAYAEYVQQDAGGTGTASSSAWLHDHDNLIITRTFSKAYGLAGFRVGYSLSSPVIADVLNRVRQPFNVNLPALAAAEAALHDSEHLKASVHLNREGMILLEKGFRSAGLAYIPSAGNFIAVDVARDAAPVYQALLREGVIVRPVANYGMPHHLRVTIGLPEENARFLAALEKVLVTG